MVFILPSKIQKDKWNKHFNIETKIISTKFYITFFFW